MNALLEAAEAGLKLLDQLAQHAADQTDLQPPVWPDHERLRQAIIRERGGNASDRSSSSSSRSLGD
jgi:hypothetical protein